MSPRTNPLHLFEATGVEIEYMIVDRQSLDIAPVADRLLTAAAPSTADPSAEHAVSDIERGPIAWSNELVLHVLELKTNGPAAHIDQDLLTAFRRDIAHAEALLEPLGARLMPGAMHPWMDPARETRIWPHESSEIYRTYDRIFDCRGHGWSNLQSLHLNLPFANDEEFGRLHAAIRLLLPILPALAASSPIEEGRVMPSLDTRLEHYRRNQARVPSVAGDIVPEPLFSQADYEREILQRVADDFRALDPEGVLSREYINSRGAIARFSRGSIEIRVLDAQECPRADLAVAALVRGVLVLLVEERWSPLARQQSWPTAPLAAVYRAAVRDADETVIDDADYLASFGVACPSLTAGELWRHLAARVVEAGVVDASWRATLEDLMRLGPLARRLRRALDAPVGAKVSTERLQSVYHRLCTCLHDDQLFAAD